MGRIFRSQRGFTLIELLTVAAILGTAGEASVYLQAQKRARAVECINNLRQINFYLAYYVIDEGKLPDATFYPENPEKDSDSILVILRKKYKGVNKRLFLCSSAPEKLKKKGLTYLWNDACSGKQPERIKDRGKTWLMIEIHALGKVRLEDLEKKDRKKVPEKMLRRIPAPHRGKYTILYADGHIAHVKEVPTLKPKKEEKKERKKHEDGEKE